VVGLRVCRAASLRPRALIGFAGLTTRAGRVSPPFDRRCELEPAVKWSGGFDSGGDPSADRRGPELKVDDEYHVARHGLTIVYRGPVRLGKGP